MEVGESNQLSIQTGDMDKLRAGDLGPRNSVDAALQKEVLAINGRIKEGFIKKWVNYYRGFKSRYFVLNDELIMYYKTKNGQVSERGQISLKLARVDCKTMKDKKMVISTGTNQIHLEFASIEEKREWLTAIDQC